MDEWEEAVSAMKSGEGDDDVLLTRLENTLAFELSGRTSAEEGHGFSIDDLNRSEIQRHITTESWKWLYLAWSQYECARTQYEILLESGELNNPDKSVAAAKLVFMHLRTYRSKLEDDGWVLKLSYGADWFDPGEAVRSEAVLRCLNMDLGAALDGFDRPDSLELVRLMVRGAGEQLWLDVRSSLSLAAWAVRYNDNDPIAHYQALAATQTLFAIAKDVADNPDLLRTAVPKAVRAYKEHWKNNISEAPPEDAAPELGRQLFRVGSVLVPAGLGAAKSLPHLKRLGLGAKHAWKAGKSRVALTARTIKDAKAADSEMRSLRSQVALFQSENKALRARVAHLKAEGLELQTDALTRAWRIEALRPGGPVGKAIEEARNSGKQIGILFGDLKDFKPFNDVFGHPAGDQWLRETASLLSRNVRKGDFIVRRGGDEFVIIAVDIKPEKLGLMHKALEARVRESAVRAHYQDHLTRRAADISQRAALNKAFRRQISGPADVKDAGTIRFGATLLEKGETLETAIARADAGLLNLKR